jgi:hypothetical protein
MPTGRLPSIIALAIGAVLTMAAGGGVPEAGNAPAGKAPVAKAAPPLITEAQRADIEKFIDKHGRKAVIDPDTAKGLGIAKDDSPVTADQVSLLDKADPKGRHRLYRLSDNGGYLVEREKSDLRALYYLRKDLKVVKGLTLQPGKHRLTIAEAQRQLRGEMATWAAVAGQGK